MSTEFLKKKFVNSQTDFSDLKKKLNHFVSILTGPSLDAVNATSSEFLSTQNTAMSIVLSWSTTKSKMKQHYVMNWTKKCNYLNIGDCCSIHSDEELTLVTSAFETLYCGQLHSSKQIILKYPNWCSTTVSLESYPLHPLKVFCPYTNIKSGKLLNDVMLVSMLVTESKEALSSDKD